jgi:ribosomal protein S18 acetylase RimI-like enzyme
VTYRDSISSVDVDRFLHANYSQEPLTRRLETLAGSFIVACRNDAVVGFAYIGPNREGDQELFAIYVLPALQQQSVGSALWQAAERQVRQSGALHFHLWVLSSNEQAIDFYRSKGGTVSGSRAFHVGDTEINETRFSFQLE